MKVVLRALGFNPTNEEIIKLIRDLGRGGGDKKEKSFDEERIDF